MKIIIACIALVGVGAGGTYLLMRERGPALPATQPRRAPSEALEAPSASAPQDIRITLSTDAIARAGIVVDRARTSVGGRRIRVPATVQPNAYRSVVVTSLVSGRVSIVSAQLGQRVRRGQMLAQLYSPELADAHSRYLSARAELDAHERELRRTEKLVELGSASRQELERIHAEHTAAVTRVQSLRSRLTLLGVTADHLDKLTSTADITASVTITAPIDGVITQRDANPGLNADPSAKLFTVVDISTVWLIGNLYERDFGRVRVGSPVTITSSAYPTMALEAKVGYIDPHFNPDTRTAQVRVEVPNPGSQFRLGMLAEMEIGETTTERVMVPTAAVQVIGNRSVIYLADPAESGRFIEREVRVGDSIGDHVEITSGIRAGDALVVKGAFGLRAERERLGLSRSAGEAR